MECSRIEQPKSLEVATGRFTDIEKEERRTQNLNSSRRKHRFNKPSDGVRMGSVSILFRIFPISLSDFYPCF